METENRKEYIANNIIQVSQQESQKNYQTWSESYDKDVTLLNFELPKHSVDLLMRLGLLTGETVLLDVGAGLLFAYLFYCKIIIIIISVGRT